jgi:hypothetical protein
VSAHLAALVKREARADTARRALAAGPEHRRPSGEVHLDTVARAREAHADLREARAELAEPEAGL